MLIFIIYLLFLIVKSLGGKINRLLFKCKEQSLNIIFYNKKGGWNTKNVQKHSLFLIMFSVSHFIFLNHQLNLPPSVDICPEQLALDFDNWDGQHQAHSHGLILFASIQTFSMTFFNYFSYVWIFLFLFLILGATHILNGPHLESDYHEEIWIRKLPRQFLSRGTWLGHMAGSYCHQVNIDFQQFLVYNFL